VKLAESLDVPPTVIEDWEAVVVIAGLDFTTVMVVLPELAEWVVSAPGA
jgi:hypothetical protein